MFIIKEKQLKAFDVMQPETFRPRMVQYLANNYYEKACILGKKILVVLIDDALIDIESYCFTRGFEVCCYIEIIIKLGRGFNTDPLLEGIIRLPKLDGTNTIKKMQYLLELADSFDKNTRNADEQFPLNIYNKLINITYDQIKVQLDTADTNGLLRYFKQIWPQKFSAVNIRNFEALFKKGKQKAITYNLTSREGQHYYNLLLFLLGHDFDIDHQYIWFAKILLDPVYDTEYYKLHSLHFTLQKYFESLIKISYT